MAEIHFCQPSRGAKKVTSLLLPTAREGVRGITSVALLIVVLFVFYRL